MVTRNDVGSPDWIDPDDAPVLLAAEMQDVEVFQGNSYVRRGRGRPPTGEAKEQVSVRLDQDVLARLRAAGPGWQAQVNALLRAALGLAAGPTFTGSQSTERLAAELRAAEVGRDTEVDGVRSQQQDEPSR